jgi:peptide/nickel transport system permease protein
MARFFKLLSRNRFATFGLVVMVLLLGSSLLVSFSNTDPTAQDLSAVLQLPSWQHLFGTDHLGRDLLGRVLYAGRTSVTILAVILGSSFVLGVVVGVLAGYIGGWFDELLMRVVDLFLSMPTLIIATALIGTRGSFAVRC